MPRRTSSQQKGAIIIRTIQELFGKLQADGRCKSVPADKLDQVQRGKKCESEEEEANQAMEWLNGYLFCLADEAYISDEEWDNLHSALYV